MTAPERQPSTPRRVVEPPELLPVPPGSVPTCRCGRSMIVETNTDVALCLVCDWWPDRDEVARGLGR